MIEQVLSRHNGALRVKITVKTLISVGIIALAVILPQIIHLALGAPGGVQWLPMYLPILLSGMSHLSQVEENTGFMRDFKPLTEAEERALKEVKSEYQKAWKYRCDNWAALDDNAYGVPISEIIRAYNSMFIQPDPFFSAELNYYKSFRSAYDLAFETGDYSKETAEIGGAFDVTEALKEAVKTQFENSFQSYMD